MLEGSQFGARAVGRSLRDEEKAILRAMLGSKRADDLGEARVIDANDGDMCSIRFVHSENDVRSFGSEIARAEYQDSDGVLVSISLNDDSQGDLYELDLWKIDFEALKAYPQADQIRIVPQTTIP